MKRRIHPQQMEAWVEKLQNKMRGFLDNPTADREQRLAFIREQYVLLGITVKVLDGDVYLTGCSHPKN